RDSCVFTCLHLLFIQSCILTIPPPLLYSLFFNDTFTTDIYSLSLHDALPIFFVIGHIFRYRFDQFGWTAKSSEFFEKKQLIVGRSEEHTSELQSRFDIVCRLLLEKKKIIRRS